jgi:hypothetical protein
MPFKMYWFKLHVFKSDFGTKYKFFRIRVKIDIWAVYISTEINMAVSLSSSHPVTPGHWSMDCKCKSTHCSGISVAPSCNILRNDSLVFRDKFPRTFFLILTF